MEHGERARERAHIFRWQQQQIIELYSEPENTCRHRHWHTIPKFSAICRTYHDENKRRKKKKNGICTHEAPHKTSERDMHQHTHRNIGESRGAQGITATSSKQSKVKRLESFILTTKFCTLLVQSRNSFSIFCRIERPRSIQLHNAY